jgi:hypothetical protein
MKTTLTDREFDKFRDGKNGDAVAVTFEGDSLQVETSGVEWDEIITSFPSATEEVYTYKKNDEIVQTVAVTYQAIDKKVIVYMQKTRF